MSTVIVGAGLAGLATSIKLRMFGDEEVILLEKPTSSSNTRVADQRYRAGLEGVRQDSLSELEEVLARRNNGVLTSHMKRFASIAVQELAFWQQLPDFMPYEDRQEWFGPLWGISNGNRSGWGNYVLLRFKALAEELGVSFVTGEARHLEIQEGVATSLLVDRNSGLQRFCADRYVLANGSISGQMFRDSTNARIKRSAHELAFASNLELSDSTIHMIHPFGRAGIDGRSRRGCYPADELCEATVLINGVIDHETTKMLQSHNVREHFAQLGKKFRSLGGCPHEIVKPIREEISLNSKAG